MAASAMLVCVNCGTGAIAPAGVSYPATFSEPEPSVTDEPTGTNTPLPTSSPEPTPSASVSPNPNLTPSPTPTPTATKGVPTPTPTPTPTVSPAPTPTPSVTPTPTPTPTAAPVGSGSGTLSGHVLLSTFTPASATWTSEGGALVVTLWQSANACTKWTKGEEPAGGYLRMSVGTTAATYSIGGASAVFDVLDANCQSTIVSPLGNATSGQVALTAAPTGATGDATGTYSLIFGLQTVTGTFNATPCAAIADPPASLTCSP